VKQAAVDVSSLHMEPVVCLSRPENAMGDGLHVCRYLIIAHVNEDLTFEGAPKSGSIKDALHGVNQLFP
jgi:hypothetical protein